MNEEEAESSTDKLSTVIPAFFYDLICHIAPGAVVVAIYWSDTVVNNKANPLLIPSLLIVTWGIGLTLEVITHIPFFIFTLRKLRKSYAASGPSFWKVWWDEDASSVRKNEKPAILKYHAETVFFRILCFVSFINLILHFCIKDLRQPEPEPLTSLICFSIFFICWCFKMCERKNYIYKLHKPGRPHS
jgi:hypothetical protein